MTLEEAGAILARHHERLHAVGGAQEVARGAYLSTHIIVHADAEVLPADGGAWVAAWVWVDQADIDARLIALGAAELLRPQSE